MNKEKGIPVAHARSDPSLRYGSRGDPPEVDRIRKSSFFKILNFNVLTVKN